MILVSKSIRPVRIFAGVPYREGVPNDRGVGFSKTTIFSCLISYKFHKSRLTLSHTVPRRLFGDLQMHDFEWPWIASRISRWILVFFSRPDPKLLNRPRASTTLVGTRIFRFSVSGLKDEKWLKKQTKTKSETCKLYSSLLNIWAKCHQNRSLQCQLFQVKITE